MKRGVKMRVLVACEESQAVTAEFRKIGHEAYAKELSAEQIYIDMLEKIVQAPTRIRKAVLSKRVSYESPREEGIHMLGNAAAGSGGCL